MGPGSIALAEPGTVKVPAFLLLRINAKADCPERARVNKLVGTSFHIFSVL